MDDPLVLNELTSWCKAKKQQCLLLKMHFQKAFDSVCWDHLDEILGKFGFGNKWQGWIRGCLNSSKALVLVNGSPTNEFSFHKGLRQGDPFSPFLFILVMESLQVSFQKLIDRGLFVLALVGKEDRLPISHLLYADDAMFIGLKVNVHKSSLYGVGVHDTDVQLMAAPFGCVGNTLPFTYLGVKEKGVDLMKYCKLVIGNGNATRFWHHRWCGDVCFKARFHRLFNLEPQKDVSVASKLQAPTIDCSFRRAPRSVESRNHLFFGCSMALDLFRLLGRWWNIDIMNLIDLFFWESWFNDLRLNNLQKLALEASFFFMLWHICKYMNAILFSLKKPLKGLGLTIDVGSLMLIGLCGEMTRQSSYLLCMDMAKITRKRPKPDKTNTRMRRVFKSRS
uniref:RNA-directed DNA polymerase, eukaryota, reverse transcriptase zinc-binding domain protein n=1 Tax=Tanacetum cinerariifolium TaxID=118510 RepID=A0A6L2JEK7_TANCI|nr:RNA-directed DNA polymerase, eukaryota, reverse transcriptase zinc-binding domain protein [Tanacetum cinerariifolium]